MNSGLTSITIPKSVTTIGSNAFSNCSALKTVTFENGSHLESIGDYAFENSGLTSIKIPKGATSIGSSAFSDSGLTSINIPKSVTSIGDNAFKSSTAKTLNINTDMTEAEWNNKNFPTAKQGSTTLNITFATASSSNPPYIVESAFVSYAPKAKANLTYTGKPQELITKGQGFWGTIKYSLDKENWSATVPTAVESGKYTVYYKVFADINHRDSAIAKLEAEILPSKAPTNVKISADGTMTWDKADGAVKYVCYKKVILDDGKKKNVAGREVTDTTYKFKNLENATKVLVQAIDADGNKFNSEWITIPNTAELTTPPSNVKLAADGTITWSRTPGAVIVNA